MELDAKRKMSVEIARATEFAEASRKRPRMVAGLATSTSEEIEKELVKVQVGEHWDKLLGEQYDVLVAENEAKLLEQLLETMVSFFGIDCKSFSRARGCPVPGAKTWPKALRSASFPLGLPNLQRT